MGVGVFHRHGALRPTPVPSAMTYFQSGFLFRSNRPSQKRFRLISSSEAIYDIAGEPKWSQPPTRWEVHYLEILSTRPEDSITMSQGSARINYMYGRQDGAGAADTSA